MAAAATATAFGLVLSTGTVAVAGPQLTVAQVQKKLTELYARADKLDQQLDQAKQELATASQRLKIVSREAARYSKQFNGLRSEVGRIAAQAYEQGSLNSSMELLTSGNPQQILNQSSILLELSSANAAEMDQFIAAAKALTSAQAAALHTREGIAKLKASLSKRKAALEALISKEKALLDRLTPPQRAGAGPGGGSGYGHYHGPTGTQADKAVQFVYDQLGCPYDYGGTGPCHPGFDCSGLMQAAWAYAGISIPRTSYDQMGSLESVSTSDLQPGDILGFAGNSHVGMYVGGGYLIDAPHTGLAIEKVKLAGWYSEELDGAVVP